LFLAPGGILARGTGRGQFTSRPFGAVLQTPGGLDEAGLAVARGLALGLGCGLGVAVAAPAVAAPAVAVPAGAVPAALGVPAVVVPAAKPLLAGAEPLASEAGAEAPAAEAGAAGIPVASRPAAARATMTGHRATRDVYLDLIARPPWGAAAYHSATPGGGPSAAASTVPAPFDNDVNGSSDTSSPNRRCQRSAPDSRIAAQSY